MEDIEDINKEENYEEKVFRTQMLALNTTIDELHASIKKLENAVNALLAIDLNEFKL